MCLKFLERKQTGFDLDEYLNSEDARGMSKEERERMIRLLTPMPLCTHISNSFNKKFSNIDWDFHRHYTLPMAVVAIVFIALAVIGVCEAVERYENYLNEKFPIAQGIKL